MPELWFGMKPLVESLGVEPRMQQAVADELQEGPHPFGGDNVDEVLAVLRQGYLSGIPRRAGPAELM